MPERFNKYLAETVAALPQLREIGVLDTDGKWRYSSLPETPRHNNADRTYFTYHRDTPGKTLRISEPLQSRLTGRPTILLSKRINKQDGSFGGVLTAAIDSDYFNGFYRTFQLGPDGGISLLRNDGVVLIRWPLSDRSYRSFQNRPVHDPSQAELRRILQDHLAVRRHREILRLRGNAAVIRWS